MTFIASSFFSAIVTYTLIIFTSFTPLCSEIVTIKSMTEILPYVDNDTLALFDADETLMVADTMAFSPRGGEFLQKRIREALKSGEVEKETCDLIASLFYVNYIPELIEENSPAIFNEIISQGCQTMLLTARESKSIGSIKDTFDILKKQLNDLGFTFTFMNDHCGQVISGFYSEDRGPPLFREGCLLTAHQLKGDVLLAFFDQIGFTPKKVIFVDDRLKQIDSVHKALTSRGIPVTCFHYLGAIEHDVNYDEAVLSFQFDHLLKTHEWISDSEALERITQYRQ